MKNKNINSKSNNQISIETNNSEIKEEYAIEMLNIRKEFPGIVANDDVTLQVKKGEIHALLGENGAGKSTLMSVLFGLYQPEKGIIKKDGVEIKINNPNDATNNKIGMVHQHFKLVECFTVLDNIILGSENFTAFDLSFSIVPKLKKINNDLAIFIKNLNKDESLDENTKQLKIKEASDEANKKIDEAKNESLKRIADLEQEIANVSSKDNRTKDDNKRLKLLQSQLKAAKKSSNGFDYFVKNLINNLNKFVFKHLDRKKAGNRIKDLSNKYGLNIDLDAKIENISVGMQQRVEILKMLYRNNEILIFDEPTAVLTPQEIIELMEIMRNLAKEGKSLIFISHKLNEILEVSDAVTVLRKGKGIGTVITKETNADELSRMMVGRDVSLTVDKSPVKLGDEVLRVENLEVLETIHHKTAVNNVSFNVRRGEIVCIAGIDGNGQSELVYGLTGLYPLKKGKILLNNNDVTNFSIRKKNDYGMSHIPEDRHKHGLILDYSLENNIVLKKYYQRPFEKLNFLQRDPIRDLSDSLISEFDIRSSNGSTTTARSMSGGNQQKAIVAREINADKDLLIAVQPTRGLDVGAIENIHKRIVEERDKGKAVLLISLELEEVMNLSDRILVMYEGEIVAEKDPREISTLELGLYMSGNKNDYKDKPYEPNDNFYNREINLINHQTSDKKNSKEESTVLKAKKEKTVKKTESVDENSSKQKATIKKPAAKKSKK